MHSLQIAPEAERSSVLLRADQMPGTSVSQMVWSREYGSSRARAHNRLHRISRQVRL